MAYSLGGWLEVSGPYDLCVAAKLDELWDWSAAGFPNGRVPAFPSTWRTGEAPGFSTLPSCRRECATRCDGGFPNCPGLPPFRDATPSASPRPTTTARRSTNLRPRDAPRPRCGFAP